jgi:hypothetical protein
VIGVITLATIMTANFMYILNVNKRNFKSFFKEHMSGIQKDYELQTILFSLEGAIIIFKDKSIRFINGSSENIFNHCDPNFQSYNNQMNKLQGNEDQLDNKSHQMISEHLQSLKIFKAHRNTKVTMSEKEESKQTSANPSSKGKKICDD